MTAILINHREEKLFSILFSTIVDGKWKSESVIVKIVKIIMMINCWCFFCNLHIQICVHNAVLFTGGKSEENFLLKHDYSEITIELAFRWATRDFSIGFLLFFIIFMRWTRFLSKKYFYENLENLEKFSLIFLLKNLRTKIKMQIFYDFSLIIRHFKSSSTSLNFITF